MKASERDDLLIRLDERSCNIYKLTEKQEEHLRQINGHLDDHSSRLTTVETKIDERTRKVSKKAIAGYSGGGLLLVALTVLQIIQALG